jgi:hypothetical protein
MRPRTLTGVWGVFVFGQLLWQSTLSSRNECNPDSDVSCEPALSSEFERWL